MTVISHRGWWKWGPKNGVYIFVCTFLYRLGFWNYVIIFYIYKNINNDGESEPKIRNKEKQINLTVFPINI